MSSRLICPTCGLAHSMSSAFCRSCGSPLAPDPSTPAPTDPNAPASSQPAGTGAPVKCANCQTLNDARNLRCLRCGSDLR